MVWERYCLFTASADTRRCFSRGSRLASSSRFGPDLLRHYPREITFLPVVATSSFRPYLETSPVLRWTAGENRHTDEGGWRRQQPSSKATISPRVPADDERVKERKKANGTAAGSWRGRQIRRAIENYTGIGFTSGRFNHADMPTLIRVRCPCNTAISRRPRGTRRIVGGSTESRGLWDRISSLDTSCDEFAKVTTRSKQDNKMHCRCILSQEIINITRSIAIK